MKKQRERRFAAHQLCANGNKYVITIFGNMMALVRLSFPELFHHYHHRGKRRAQKRVVLRPADKKAENAHHGDGPLFHRKTVHWNFLYMVPNQQNRKD